MRRATAARDSKKIYLTESQRNRLFLYWMQHVLAKNCIQSPLDASLHTQKDI